MIVYDQNKHGIEESLARIATEVARFRGYSFDPIYIEERDVSKLAAGGGYSSLRRKCAMRLKKLSKSSKRRCTASWAIRALS